MKQKISKHEREEEDNRIVGVDNFDEKKIQSKERVCDVCNKVFGSGKALGGHMRIHFQAYKDLIFKVNKKKNLKTKESMKKKLKNSSSSSSVVEFGSVEPRCALCGKIFPSMKSLFGHMRCHPEREWRGIHPPPPPSPSPTPSPLSEAELIDEESSEQVHLLEVLPKWSVTAKRGRKPVNMLNYYDMEEEFRAAALHLMMLAKGRGDSCDRPSSDFIQEHQKGNEFIVMHELVDKEGKGSTDGANSSNDVLMESARKCKNVVASDDELGSNESSIIGKESLIIKSKERKRVKESEEKDEGGGYWNTNISPLEMESPSILQQNEVSGHNTGRGLDFDLNELPLVEENHNHHHHHTGGCHFASSLSIIDHDLLK